MVVDGKRLVAPSTSSGVCPVSGSAASRGASCPFAPNAEGADGITGDSPTLRRPLPAAPVNPELFDLPYEQSRRAFREAAAECGFRTTSVAIPAEVDDDLTVDVAWIFSPDPSASGGPQGGKGGGGTFLDGAVPGRVLLVGAAPVGADGPMGSALAIRYLRSLPSPREAGDLIVVVHSLNPFGHARGRGCNSAGVDAAVSRAPHLARAAAIATGPQKITAEYASWFSGWRPENVAPLLDTAVQSARLNAAEAEAAAAAAAAAAGATKADAAAPRKRAGAGGQGGTKRRDAGDKASTKSAPCSAGRTVASVALSHRRIAFALRAGADWFRTCGDGPVRILSQVQHSDPALPFYGGAPASAAKHCAALRGEGGPEAYATLPSELLFGTDVPEWTALVDILTAGFAAHLAKRVSAVTLSSGVGPYGDVQVSTPHPLGSRRRVAVEAALATRTVPARWYPRGEDGVRASHDAMRVILGDAAVRVTERPGGAMEPPAAALERTLGPADIRGTVGVGIDYAFRTRRGALGDDEGTASASPAKAPRGAPRDDGGGDGGGGDDDDDDDDDDDANGDDVFGGDSNDLEDGAAAWFFADLVAGATTPYGYVCELHDEWHEFAAKGRSRWKHDPQGALTRILCPDDEKWRQSVSSLTERHLRGAEDLAFPRAPAAK